MKKAPIWHESKTLLRRATETENDFARRINVVAERLRQRALDAHSGKHPKIVVHFSEPRTEAYINVTVVW
jgi:hypothetical protein